MPVQNNVVGTLFVQLQPIATGFNAQVQAIINNAAKNATVNVNVQANTSQVQAGLQAINQNLIAAAANTRLFEEGMRRLGTGVSFVINQFGGLFDTLVRARIGFENLLGENAGDQLLQQVRELAKETPFTNNILVKYSQQLLAVGLSADQIIPTLQAVGDLIFTVGGGTQNIERVLYAMSQVQATGRLIGQDARQFQDALIPIQRYIADFLDTSIAEVQELQRLGEISSETVFAAIRSAGENVAGAMQNANLTVEGSLEILRGTLQTFIQDQPVLQEIFQGIVNTINDITETIESEDFQQRIASLFAGLEETIEGLQPVFQGIREAFGAGFLTFLDAITSSLEILAEVLDAIPEPVLRALGVFFVTLAALKVPTAFLGYVSGLTRLFQSVGNGQLVAGLTGTAGGVQNTGTAAQAATSRLQSFNVAAANMAGRLNALAAAATVAGIAISQGTGDNQVGQIAGGALAGAGTGAIIGSSIAPGIGTAIGAAGGAILGGVTSYFTAAREEVESFQQELQERGAEAASEFVRQFNLQFQGDQFTDAAQGVFFSELDQIRSQREEVLADIDALKTQSAALESELLNVELDLTNRLASLTPDQADELRNRRDQIIEDIESINDEIDNQRGKVSELRAVRDALFGSEVGQQYQEFYNNVASSLQLINDQIDLVAEAGLKSEDIFKSVFGGGQGVEGDLLAGFTAADSAADVEALEAALADLGLTIDDIIPNANRSIDDIVNDIEIGLGLVAVDAIDEATRALNDFALAIEGTDTIQGAEEALAGTLSAIQIQANAFQEAIQAQADINASLGSFFEANLENLALERIEPTIQGIADAGNAIIENANQQAQILYAQIYASTGDLERARSEASQEASNQIVQAFSVLQTTLSLTDTQFNTFLENAGLLDIFNLSLQNSTGYVQSYFSEFATQLGLTNDALADLVGLQGEITEFTIITYGAETQEALEKLQELKTLQDEIRADSSELGIRFSNQVAEQIRDLSDTVTEGISAFNPDIEEQQAAIEEQRKKDEEARKKEAERLAKEREAASKKLADEARRALEEMQRAQEAWEEKIESALESLSGSITQAMEGIQQAAREWTSSIRERTQFERAVSTQSLTRNATRQAQDLEETNAQIQSLLARGVSEQVLQSLDINNVADLRQLRRLAGASDAELFALTSAVQRRDTAAVEIAENRQQQQLQNTITAAIIAAAQTLGFSREEARAAATSIAAQISISGTTDPEALARMIENALLNTPVAAALRP